MIEHGEDAANQGKDCFLHEGERRGHDDRYFGTREQHAEARHYDESVGQHSREEQSVCEDGLH